jgi:hypothetical protein
MYRGMEEPKQRFDLVEILLQHGIQVAVLQQQTDLILYSSEYSIMDYKAQTGSIN